MEQSWDKRGGNVINGPMTFSTVAAMLRASSAVDIGWMSRDGTNCRLFIARGDETAATKMDGDRLNFDQYWTIGVRVSGGAGRSAIVDQRSEIHKGTISDWRLQWQDAVEREYMREFFEGVRKAFVEMAKPVEKAIATVEAGGTVDVAVLADQLATTEERTYGLTAENTSGRDEGASDLGFEIPRLRVPGS